jgi:hypothetical protein
LGHGDGYGAVKLDDRGGDELGEFGIDDDAAVVGVERPIVVGSQKNTVTLDAFLA